MVDIIENEACEPRHIVLPVEMIVRSSTRAIHARRTKRSRQRDATGEQA